MCVKLPLKDEFQPLPPYPTSTYICRVTITPNVYSKLHYYVFSYMYWCQAYLVTHPTRPKPIQAPLEPTPMVVNSR